MRFSQKRIAHLWVAEGGNPAKADEASAISMAESSGESRAGNSCCHGLWQLNVEVGVSSLACANNPVCATRKAISLSNDGQDWSPWEAYTNGAYRQFLGKSGAGDGTKFVDAPFHLPLPGPLDPGNIWEEAEGLGNWGLKLFGGGGDHLPGKAGQVEEGLEGVQAIGAFFVGLGELILTPEGWLRLAKLLGGAYLLSKGLNIVIRESTGVDAAKGAKKAAETAALIATVK